MKILKSMLLVFCLFTFSQSFAQRMQVQVGPVLSNLGWDYWDGPKYELFKDNYTGYAMQVGMEFFDTGYFSLTTNLGYIQSGGKQDVLYKEDAFSPGFIKSENVVLNYISLNSMVNFKFRIEEKFLPYIGLGAKFDFLTSYSEIFDDFEENDALNKEMFGVLMGYGLNYDIDNKWRCGFGGIYHLNLDEVAEMWDSSGIDLNQMNYHVNVSYALGGE